LESGGNVDTTSDLTEPPQSSPETRSQSCAKLHDVGQAADECAIDNSHQSDRFKRAIEGASDGLWDFDPTTNNVWYSEQFKKLLGLTPDRYDSFAPVLRSFVDRLHPDDKNRTMEAVREHLVNGAPYDVEYRLRLESGEYRWFGARGQSNRDKNDNVVRMSGSITDIHEQHLAQTRLDLATQAAGIGLWDWDVPSGETFFNDTFYTMLGYEPGELPMTVDTWKGLVHPDDLSAAIDDVKAHLKGETPLYKNEHRLRCNDDSWLWIRDIGEVVEWQIDGTPKRMIGVHVEVQELRDALVEVQAASQAKSEFLANMSHEIRTPMTAILGYADMLCDDGELLADPRQSTEAIQSINANANHLLTVINDVLDVSKIEAGQMGVEKIDTSPAIVVEEVVKLVSARARGKGVEFRVSYETGIPALIQTDPTRLRQILLNLCGNAIKFTDVGSVTVKVDCDPEARQVRFRVADTGIGMTPEQLDAVASFAAFTQADPSMTRKFGGTGLGLRISSSLAAILGGSMEVESILGEGSTFTVSVDTGDLTSTRWIEPMSVCSILEAEARASQRVSKGDCTEQPLKGIRILLAEDGRDNQRVIYFHLERAGAEVNICENGRIAVEDIENSEPESLPHVILMDMQMPELDGYETTRVLRDAGFAMPIVSITAHAMEGDRERCLSAGCDDYLTKPIDKKELVDTCVRYAQSALVNPQAAP